MDEKETLFLVLGVLIGWLGNKLLDAIDAGRTSKLLAAILRQRSKTKGLQQASEFFSIGKLKTNLILFDGNGIDQYSEATMECFYTSGKPECPDDIEDLLLEEERDFEQREGGWNGLGAGLLSFDLFRDPEERHLGGLFKFYASRYTDFRATVLRIMAEDRSAPDSIYQRHVAKKPFDQVVPYLARHVGVAVLVQTSDHQLVIAHRSSRTGARQGSADVSVVEGIEPTKDAKSSTSRNRIDVYSTIVRGCAEELGFEPQRSQIAVLGFGVDHDFYQFNFLAIVRSNLTFDQIVASKSANAKDRWETRIEPLPLAVMSVVDFMEHTSSWGFVTVLLYWALVGEFGIAAAEARIAQRFGS